MTREIEQINFNQSLLNLDEFATAYRSDGKGDAYLESKSWNAENSIKDSKNKGASDSTIANYEQKSHFVGSKENVEQLALNLNDNSEFPSSRNLLRENTKSIECHLKHFSNPENSNAKLSEKNNETANESNIFSKDTNSIYGSREENFKDLPIGNYDVEKHASFERTESLIDSFQATSYAIPFECPSFYSHLDLNMNPGKIKMSQNFNNVDYKSENFKELHKSDEVLGNYGTIPSEQINGSLLNDSTYQNNEIGRLDMLHNLTLVQEFADDKIELKSTLDSIFNTKNSDYQSRSHVFGSHYENAERNGNLSSSGSNDVIENEPDNDFCKLSITSSEKSGGNTKRSQTGVRQIENTLSDSKLNTEKKFCIIKASQSVNNASKNFLSEQSTSSLARIKAESIDDGSFSLAKEVEASSSPESNSFFGNGKGTVKGFENDAQFILPQVSLFSNKSEDEMTEIEKLNHINFDSSSASSFLRKTAKESDEKSDLKNQENFKSSSSLEKLINYSSFTALTRNGQKEQQEFIEREYEIEI